MTTASVRRTAARFLPGFRQRAAWVRGLIAGGARWGYAARATVYLSVGVIALLAALRLTPQAEGAVEALEAWSAWRPGIALLWLTGLGLYAFAAWRGLQAIFDVEDLGMAPAALAERAGKAISGVIYCGLAVSVFGVLDALEDLREVDDQASTQAAIEAALAYPNGDVAVAGLGGVIVAAGVGNAIRACASHFTDSLDCEGPMAAWAGTLARVGYFARGVVMAGAGLLTISAGLHARAQEARGVGGALEWLKDRPFGHAALAVLGLGLIAFAAFGYLKATLRRIAC